MNTDIRLTALSPLDGRYAKHVQDLSDYFSEFALMKYRLLVEVQWLICITQDQNITALPPLNDKQQAQLQKLADSFDLKACQTIKNQEESTNHDVKAVEYYIKQALEKDPTFKPYLEFIHFACTSEDINNLSYALMLKNLRDKILLPQLEQLQTTLKKWIDLGQDLPMLSRTHGQPASPTTVGKEFANIHYRLQRQIKALKAVEMLGKINGAVGNYNAHVAACPNVDWIALSQKFVTNLGLTWNPLTTQIEPHDFQAEIYHALIRVNTILIDFSRDIWGYIAFDYFKQKLKENEVGSSTMPHKVNPIDFENAEGNLGLSTALLSHLAEKLPVSRWQRDLTDSTVQRNIGVGMGYHHLALQSLFKGLNKLELNEEKIKTDLNAHWEVLGEAIQTVLRKHQVIGAYEQLKAFTRGKTITQALLHSFIDTLNLPIEVKEELKTLTPENYIGLAKDIVFKMQDRPSS